MKQNDPSSAMMQKAVNFHQQGQMPEAEKSYLDVLAADPRHVDALRLLGSLYVQWSKSKDAIECFEKALNLEPNHPELLNNLGVALYSEGRLNDALKRYQQAIDLAPNYTDALNNLGHIFYTCGKLDDAISLLKRSAQLKADNPKTYVFLGHAYRMQEQGSQAIAYYKKALHYLPDNPELLTIMGNMLRAAGKSDEACTIYQHLAALKPDDIGILINLGTIYHDLGQGSKSMEQYDKVLKLQPRSTDAMICRGSLMMEMDQPEEAYRNYEQALAINSNLSDAKWGKSLAALMLGHYIEGWALYETRFECKPMRDSILFRHARWNGEDLHNKRLLIWSEQGFGDMLQFIRYAALCKDKGAKVIVQCREPLGLLLKNCPYIDEVVTTARSDSFDYQIPIMSLPHIFGTTLETVPHNIPYIYVSDEARQKWLPRFADAKGYKVGLVWSGNPRKNQIDAHVTDRQRSLSLATLQSLLKVKNCQFYSLQKGDAAADIAIQNLQTKIIDYMHDADNFMDTAAIIENLDLVISVDTSVAHLAGALGKPVWILSRFGGCWRWLGNKPSSPWYPTARIFGQESQGNWSSCIENVRLALEAQSSKLG